MSGILTPGTLEQNLGAQDVAQRPSKIDLQARLIAEKLNISGPHNAAQGIKPGDDFDASNMILPVMDIRFYDKNPRTSTNAKYEEIKEGIRARRSLGSSLSVTRRPGSSHYMVYMGGNTRLLALQELWKETQDPVFQQVPVIFYQWKSESDVISAHLIENEARAETTFWEKANGLFTLKDELEKETGHAISAAALSDHVKTLGMNTGVSTVKRYAFAIEWLKPIGSHLRSEDIKLLQPHMNVQKLLMKQFFPQDPGIYPRLLQASLEHIAVSLAQNTETFNVQTLTQSLDTALAQAIDVPVAHVRQMLNALARDQSLTRDALLAQQAASDVATSPTRTKRDKKSSPVQTNSIEEPASSAIPKDTAPIPGTHPLQTAQSLVSQIAEHAFLQDCLRLDDHLPCGFYMEMPNQLIEACDIPNADVTLRRAGWQILAMLAGQFRKQTADLLPETSRWRQTIHLDPFGERSLLSEYQMVLQGICSEHGELGTTFYDLQNFIWHSIIGPLFRDLMAVCHIWKTQEPKRFGHLPIGSKQ